jgi:LysM repeat protein
MNAKIFYQGVALLGLHLAVCGAAPFPNNRPLDDGRQMRMMLSDLQHELGNHETEIKMVNGRLQTQENLLEGIRQQLADNVQNQQDLSRAQNVHLEGKIDSLDKVVQNLISDLRQIKSQANDSVSILGQYRQKLADMEKIIEAQNLHMKNLEAALNSIVEVLQAKEATEKVAAKSPEAPKTYKVQPGDSLEKIARHHKVSLFALRELNGLTQDRIFVGQTLKIP